MPRPVHIAVAQVKPRKGEYRENLERLGTLFARAAAESPRPQLIHLPETALTGYFLEGGVREHAITAGTLARDLARVHAEHARGAVFDVAIGFYEVWEHKLYNSAMYVTLGLDEPVIHHVHRKVFLPTYGLFDEERFVERGSSVRAFDSPIGRVAMLVCEDAWHSLSGTMAALDGAEIVLVSAAAPARGAHSVSDVPGPASLARWERLVREIADEHGVFVSLSHLTGSEGGKLFVGGSVLVGPKGDVRVRAPLWDEAIATATIDLADLTRARADMPLIADLETMMPHLVSNLERVIAREEVWVRYDDAVEEEREPATRGAPPKHNDRSATPAAHHQSIPATTERTPSPAIAIVRATDTGGPPPLDIDPVLVTEWLVRFIRTETAARRFPKAIVGVSGGVDSAVTAFLAARALGAENVIGVRMPYRTSSPASLEHAQLVIDALGIPARTLDISAAVDGYLSVEPDADATRRGNVMARVRMIALFDLGQAVGAAVRHRQQDRASVRLLHLARRRLAAGQPVRRPVQDPGLGARPAPRRPWPDRRQGALGRSRRRPDRRRRLRHQLREGGSHPQPHPRRVYAGRGRRARLRRCRGRGRPQARRRDALETEVADRRDAQS
jgi:NAD+ synthase (glutamine-hydrolysing)